MASKKMIGHMLATIRMIYPSKDDDDIQVKARLWERLLQEYSDDQVNMALYTCLQEMKYPPVPADIIDRMKPSKSQLWAELYDALVRVDSLIDKMTYAGSSERAELRTKIHAVWLGLSGEVQGYLGTETQLQVMAGMSDTQLQFEKGTFMKADFRAAGDKKLIESAKTQKSLKN